MFIAALFITAKIWNQPVFHGYMDKEDVHTMECYTHIHKMEYSVQLSSVVQWCLTLCDHMNCSMPGLPVHHQLLESTQIHVHRVDDAIQPSHLLSSPSPPTLNLSPNQAFPMNKLFASGGQSIGVSASIPVFPMNAKD